MPAPNETAAGPAIGLSAAVRDALADGRPVVALESTIFSNLGLPAPANAEALSPLPGRRAGRNGAEPAVTAVLDGVARVGIEAAEEERVLDVLREGGRT